MSPSSSKEPLTPEDIRIFMEKKGMSVAYLASILGVDESTVRRWTSNDSATHPTGTAEMILRTLMLGSDASVSGASLLAMLNPISMSVLGFVGGVAAMSLGGMTAKFLKHKKDKEALEHSYELYRNLREVFEPLEQEIRRDQSGTNKPDDQ